MNIVALWVMFLFDTKHCQTGKTPHSIGRTDAVRGFCAGNSVFAVLAALVLLILGSLLVFSRLLVLVRLILLGFLAHV